MKIELMKKYDIVIVSESVIVQMDSNRSHSKTIWVSSKNNKCICWDYTLHGLSEELKMYFGY